VWGECFCFGFKIISCIFQQCLQEQKQNLFTPDTLDLKSFGKRFFFETSDHEKIQAWFFKQRKVSEANTILYFHGNAGNLSHLQQDIANQLKYLGCNVFIVSYRGYGKSTGSPTEKGIKLDSQAALNYLLARPDVDPSKIIIFGLSLGGAVACHLTANNPDKIKALILENTFTSISDMIDIVFSPLRRLKFLCLIKWSSENLMSKITCPILLMCGEQDELVPASQMKRLHAAATSSRSAILHVFPLGKHMDTWNQPNYYEHFKKFLERLEQ